MEITREEISEHCNFNYETNSGGIAFRVSQYSFRKDTSEEIKEQILAYFKKFEEVMEKTLKINPNLTDTFLKARIQRLMFKLPFYQKEQVDYEHWFKIFEELSYPYSVEPCNEVYQSELGEFIRIERPFPSNNILSLFVYIPNIEERGLNYTGIPSEYSPTNTQSKEQTIQNFVNAHNFVKELIENGIRISNKS